VLVVYVVVSMYCGSIDIHHALTVHHQMLNIRLLKSLFSSKDIFTAVPFYY